jgi:hypothetical protein
MHLLLPVVVSQPEVLAAVTLVLWCMMVLITPLQQWWMEVVSSQQWQAAQPVAAFLPL